MKTWLRIAVISSLVIMILLFILDPTVRIGIGEDESNEQNYILFVPWLIGGIINFSFWIGIGLFFSRTIPWIFRRFKKEED